MKNKLTILPMLFLAFILCISGCKKSDDNAGSFTWNYKGVDYTAKYTFVSSVEDLGPNIIGGVENSAVSPGSGLRFRIHPLTAGVHIIGSGGFYGSFVDINGNDLPTVGIVSITSIAGKKLSATIQLEVGIAGSQHTLKGEIRNVGIF